MLLLFNCLISEHDCGSMFLFVLESHLLHATHQADLQFLQLPWRVVPIISELSALGWKCGCHRLKAQFKPTAEYPAAAGIPSVAILLHASQPTSSSSAYSAALCSWLVLELCEKHKVLMQSKREFTDPIFWKQNAQGTTWNCAWAELLWFNYSFYNKLNNSKLSGHLRLDIKPN